MEIKVASFDELAHLRGKRDGLQSDGWSAKANS